MTKIINNIKDKTESVKKHEEIINNQKATLSPIDLYNNYIGVSNGIGMLFNLLFERITKMKYEQYMSLKIKPKLTGFITIVDLVAVSSSLAKAVQDELLKLEKDAQTYAEQEDSKEQGMRLG